MYENPKFNQNNEKILCERNGKNSDMLMDIRVKILKAGETMTFCEAERSEERRVGKECRSRWSP